MSFYWCGNYPREEAWLLCVVPWKQRDEEERDSERHSSCMEILWEVRRRERRLRSRCRDPTATSRRLFMGSGPFNAQISKASPGSKAKRWRWCLSEKRSSNIRGGGKLIWGIKSPPWYMKSMVCISMEQTKILQTLHWTDLKGVKHGVDGNILFSVANKCDECISLITKHLHSQCLVKKKKINLHCLHPYLLDSTILPHCLCWQIAGALS